MGFHWCVLCVKSESPGIPEKVFAIVGYRPTKVLRGLTFDEVLAHEGEFDIIDDGPTWTVTLDGWTYFFNAYYLDVDHTKLETEVSKTLAIAEALSTRVCYAYAESVTWVIGFDHASPDGSVRSRHFSLHEDEGAHDGSKDITVVMGTGPYREMERDSEGREFTKGAPLPGEPSGLVIGNSEKLLEVLTGIGVPLTSAMDRIYSRYDPAADSEIPGELAGERRFTLYVSAKSPAEKAELTRQRLRAERASKPGLLARLFRRR